MRKIAVMLAVTTAFFAPVSLAAQDASVPTIESVPAEDSSSEPSGDVQAMAALAGMMGAMPAVEPLTAEQQARVPQAAQIIAKIWPVGATAELSQSMFGGVLGGFGEMLPSGPKPALAESLGLGPIDLENLSDADAAEALSLFDPVWKDREGAVKGMVSDLMGEVVGMVEPPMRRAMTELYAIRFTGPELAAIDAFFSTDAGSKYARESLSMASDPRLMAASMEAMPAMFAMIGQMEERIKAHTASLPAPREFADLSPRDRARVAELTGLSVAEIEASLDMRVMTVPSPPMAVPPQID